MEEKEGERVKARTMGRERRRDVSRGMSPHQQPRGSLPGVPGSRHKNLAPVDRVVAARQSLQNANVSIPSYGVVPRPVVPAAVLSFPLLGEVKRT